MQIGFCGALGLLFIGLKLTNYINWSWWLVLLPFYVGLVIILIMFAVTVVCLGFAGTVEKFIFKFQRKIK